MKKIRIAAPPKPPEPDRLKEHVRESLKEDQRTR